MISVVIPLYNKENYIKKTVNCVLEQSFSAFELLVVDDGSKDNGPQLLSTITDPRLKVLKKTNGGVSSARNFGIQHAQYDYIAFLDADDYWHSDYLATVIALINKYPEAEVFGTNMEVIKGETKTPLSNIQQEGYIENYFKTLRTTSILHSSAVTVKKSAFDKAGLFNTNVSRGEDLDMWIRLARTSKVAYDPTIHAGYLLGAENSSSLFVPPPHKSIAYYLDVKEASSRDEKKYLKSIMLKRLMNYVVRFRVKYTFVFLKKQGLNLLR